MSNKPFNKQPLTNKILFKQFKFKKLKTDNFGLCFTKDIDKNNCILINSKYIYLMDDTNSYVVFKRKRVEYVYQLEILYLILANKKLKIYA